MGKTLCATRGGEAAIHAQDAAIAHAKETGDDLIFFYVFNIDFMARANYALRTDVVTKEMDKMAEFLLAMAVEHAAKSGIKADTVLKHGDFFEALIEVINEEGITLLVMGTPEVGAHSIFERSHLEDFANHIHEETGIDVMLAD